MNARDITLVKHCQKCKCKRYNQTIAVYSGNKEHTRPVMYAQRNIEERSRNYCCRTKKQKVLHKSVSLQPLVSSMKYACAVLSSLASLVLQYFYTSLYKRNNFRERGVTEQKRVFSLSTTSFRNMFHSNKN
jgi:hypothetical protein